MQRFIYPPIYIILVNIKMESVSIQEIKEVSATQGAEINPAVINGIFNNPEPDQYIKCEIETATLQKVINAVFSLTDTAQINFNENGLKILEMDPSQISMIDAQIPISEFSKYETNNIKFGVDVAQLKAVLSTFNPKNNLSIETKRKEKMVMVITDTITQQQAIIEDNQHETTAPKEESRVYKIEYPQQIRIKCKDALNEISKIKKLDSNTEIITDGYKMQFKDMQGLFNSQIYSTETAENQKVWLSTQYMYKLLKGIDKNANLTIHLATNAPLKITHNANYTLTFFLAPRIMST
jgi:DNA polymerase III sliding clamp (beta) subunit (PCNA family)